MAHLELLIQGNESRAFTAATPFDIMGTSHLAVGILNTCDDIPEGLENHGKNGGSHGRTRQILGTAVLLHVTSYGFIPPKTHWQGDGVWQSCRVGAASTALEVVQRQGKGTVLTQEKGWYWGLEIRLAQG